MPMTHFPPALQHRCTFAGCHPPQAAPGSLRLLFESALRLPRFSPTSGIGDPASHTGWSCVPADSDRLLCPASGLLPRLEAGALTTQLRFSEATQRSHRARKLCSAWGGGTAGCLTVHNHSSSPQQPPHTSMSSASDPVLCSSCWSNHNPSIPLIQAPVTASDIFISFSFLPPHLQKTFPSNILCLSNSK